MNEDFDQQFKSLTGHAPLLWQRRLYEARFAGDSLPAVIDLPTGLGKTMVMAIWLIARAKHPDKVPTRLVYVVDRRTVVDQATDLAIKIRDNAKSTLGLGLAISTLRGQLADNREWSRDPIRPAIVIGTVDLIGSALLFSGYRSGYKYRPHEAGLLGMDSLLVLDEAHLSKPFEKLLESIESFNKPGGAGGLPANVKPLKVIRMSATSLGENAKRFKLEDSDLEDTTIRERFAARKTLTIKTLNDKDKLTDKLANAATSLASQAELKGNRIVVFVRRPDDASKIADAIRNHGGTRNKPGPYADSVEVLTGTLRGLERDELVEKPVLKRFLDGDERPGEKTDPVFLVSTSAGEVGMDLNADHMVCDATTIDSLIQRLGRVNRRGGKDRHATVILVREPTKKKDGKPVELKGLDLAIAKTLKLLEGVTDVSPKNIAALKSSKHWSEIPQGETKSRYELACSPEPTTVPLTDILLDNWSMTSIVEPMPGRPEVGPWLRGIEQEQSQTLVAWRAEVEPIDGEYLPAKALTAILSKHPIRPHESLAVNSSYLIKEFLAKIPKLKDRPENLMSTRVAVRLPGGQVLWRSLQELNDDPSILYSQSTLILPATFGGLEGGMLNADAIPKVRKPDEAPAPSLDRADESGYEPNKEGRVRLRMLIERTDDGWRPRALPGGAAIPSDLSFEPTYERTTGLFNVLKKAGFRVRLVRPIAFDDEDEPVRSLVVLAPIGDAKKKVDQLLTDHVAAVERHAKAIADALALGTTDPLRAALEFAAKWHDEGKKAEVWQHFAYGSVEDGKWLGKMAVTRDAGTTLRGYRHEFGSLLRVQHPDRRRTMGCNLPTDLATRDLALHLIATHHGGGRPHFPVATYRDFEDVADAMHVESIQRFAGLQRKYGWWGLAWLENLLRCADQLASAEAGSDGDEDEPEGGGK